MAINDDCMIRGLYLLVKLDIPPPPQGRGPGEVVNCLVGKSEIVSSSPVLSLRFQNVSSLLNRKD